MRYTTWFLIGFVVLFLTGCATTCPPPHNKENINAIFHEYPHWYKAAKKTEKKWGVPVNVQMAIMYYESAFNSEARPPRKYILGFIPGKHISSAYGYAQALDGTWDDYLSQAGGWFAKRNKFASATDFIGWYSSQVRSRLGIPSDDPYNLYLAYHEGLGGFQRKSYLKKPWLMKYAQKVATKSQLYQNQLAFFEHGVFEPQPQYHNYVMPTEPQTTQNQPPEPQELELDPPAYVNNPIDTDEANL